TGGLPAGAQLPLHCGDSGHAGGVQQGEGKEPGGSDRGEQRPQGGGADIRAGPGKDSKGGDDGLLCDEPGDE
ncbi:50S ribosomal protein L33, partial [Dysosmobacter welbionis]